MNTGQIISGAGHAGLILWVLVGGFFHPSRDVPEVAVTSVSLLSAKQYEELAAAAVGKPDVPAGVDQPAPAKPVLDPAVSPRPLAKPRTEPAPEPQPEPLQESTPDVTQIEPLPVPDEVVAPEPLAPVADVEQPLPVPDTEAAKPQDAPRVAPVPAEAPEPDAEVAEMPTPAVSPDAAPDAPVVTEDRPEAAPEAATTQMLTTVTVAVSVAQDGIPDVTSIRMIGFEGGTEASARQAYEAARRAIIRCGAKGFQLPPEKYEQWRNIEMEFNPERMRIK